MRDFAIEGDRGFEAEPKRLAVHHGQRTGQSDTDRTGLRVWRRAKARTASAEQLRLSQKLNVRFEADDYLEI
jgi:hypothetical protein